MTNIETIRHEDGRIELPPEALQSSKTSPLYNEDLAPVPIEKRNWATYNYAALGHIFALSGKPDEAQQSLAELREMSKQHYISPYLFAVVYAGLGDKDQNLRVAGQGISRPVFFSNLAESRTAFRFAARRPALSEFSAAYWFVIVISFLTCRRTNHWT